MASEALKKAQKNYRKKINRITLDFSPADETLWQHILNQPKKQTYIKDLIRADMARTFKPVTEHYGYRFEDILQIRQEAWAIRRNDNGNPGELIGAMKTEELAAKECRYLEMLNYENGEA